MNFYLIKKHVKLAVWSTESSLFLFLLTGTGLQIRQRWVPCICSWKIAIPYTETWSFVEESASFNATEKDGKRELRTRTRILVIYSSLMWLTAIFFSDLHKCRQSSCCKSSKQAGPGKLLWRNHMLRDTESNWKGHYYSQRQCIKHW